METLRWVLPMIENKAVHKEACKTVVDLAHYRELVGPNRSESREALEKVISLLWQPTNARSTGRRAI